MIMSMGQIRKPLYKRVPDKRIAITANDIEIMEQIARFNFLTVNHIAELLDGSPKYLSKRLYDLFHAGYTRRPKSQIERYRYGGGSLKMAHGLSEKGYKELGRPKRVDHNPTRDHIKHELLIADIVTRFELASRKREGVTFIDRKTEPWSVDGTYDGKPFTFNTIPDYTFGIRFDDKPEGRNTWWFFLEADCGTMNVRRHVPWRSSIYRKLCAYWHTHQKNTLDFDNFRVLFVTTANHDRVKNMMEASRDPEVGGGSRMFLFGQNDDFLTYDPFDYPWTNSKDDIPTSLLT